MIVFHEGKPLAQQRHRMAGRIAYDPQSKIKAKIKIEFAKQIASQGFLSPLEGPISVCVDIMYTKPKSWSKTKRVTQIAKTSRPDVDNICKLYFDVLNELGYIDDSQIVVLLARKRYSDVDGVRIELSTVQVEPQELEDE